MPDVRDSTKPLISLLKMEEDHCTHTIKETMDINPTADTRQTMEDNKIAETEDASPLPKAETTWISTPLPYEDQTYLMLRKANIWQPINASIVPR